MDTTEELGQTYFYAGRPNLSASELFFIIFCEQVALQLGVSDFSAIVAILSGRNIIATRRKPGGTITGTSYASKAARRVFGDAKFPWGIKLPSFVGGYPPSTLRIRMVAQIGTWTGRAVPVVGWVILAADVSQIAYNSVVDYNRIARGDDKLW